MGTVGYPDRCPAFQVTLYGAFDSDVRFPRQGLTKPRPVTEYELEFYFSDCPGETFLDGVGHERRCGTFLCAKPGQLRQSCLPFRCRYVHLRAEDAAAEALLRSLPDAGVLPQIAEAGEIFDEMLSYADKTGDAAALWLQSCACRLLSMLMQKARTAASQHEERMLDAERYIRTHLAGELTLSALARRANLSPAYFHRQFLAFFGRTPAQYVLDLRITAAKAKLLKKMQSLSALASECGFCSQSYFCYKFKQVTGKSPLRYRREMLSRLDA